MKANLSKLRVGVHQGHLYLRSTCRLTEFPPFSLLLESGAERELAGLLKVPVDYVTTLPHTLAAQCYNNLLSSSKSLPNVKIELSGVTVIRIAEEGVAA